MSTSTQNSDEWTVQKVLNWTIDHLKKHGSESPRLEAEILLSHAHGISRIQLYTRYSDILSPEIRGKMRELVQRRAKSEPVAYLVGYREFFSLKFQVSSAVLIPRPETELIVMEAIEHAKKHQITTPQGIDLCTGSGCVGISCAKKQGTSNWVLTDISPEALAVATENVAQHQLTERVQLREGNLWDAVPSDATFDLITTNPPYIPRAEIAGLMQDVTQYEPHLALDGGEDGLDLIRHIVRELPARLRRGGIFLCEFTPEQNEAMQALLHGLIPEAQVTMLKDSHCQWRVAKLTRPA